MSTQGIWFVWVFGLYKYGSDDVADICGYGFCAVMLINKSAI